jgi:hypothetical protein
VPGQAGADKPDNPARPKSNQQAQILKTHKKFSVRFQVEQDFDIIIELEGLLVWTSV